MNHWNRLLVALGLFFLVVAGSRTVFTLTATGSELEVTLLEVVTETGLIGVPGLLLIYVGVKLPDTEILPGLYSRIVACTLGGIVLAVVAVGLRGLHPGVEIVDITGGTQIILLSVSSIAGLLVGVENARTITQAKALERKNAELRQKDRVERQNERLKRTERRLQEAVSELESSNERLEEFAYAASHDLQEPLRMVTSYLQLLERRYGEELEGDGEEYVEFAVDGAERMRAMIEGLLEYSRVETRGDPFDAVELDDVLDDALTDLQFRIEESDAEIEREPLPIVEGDENQLRQVFQNLLDNAIEYSGEEPPRIAIAAERGGSTWTISVRDDGIGIDPVDAERIFDIFQRLHSIDEHAGSGIGLAVCERIVERHGGEIGVESEPGRGSTFAVTLPGPDAESDSSGRDDEANPTRDP